MNINNKPIDKIFISAFFLGKGVRYNGIIQTLGHKLLQ